jgi:hypothetical protein
VNILNGKNQATVNMAKVFSLVNGGTEVRHNVLMVA